MDTLHALQLAGLDNWLVGRHTEGPWELWGAGGGKQVVVLSPDAPEALFDFSPDCVYIIGGIVDRSVRANQTLHVAAKRGVICRRLPLREFAPHNQSHALNVDCCLHIVCSWLETRDWARTLARCLPARKTVKATKSLAQREAEAALKEAAEAEEEEEEEEWEVSLEKRASSSRWVRWVEREVGLQNAKFM